MPAKRISLDAKDFDDIVAGCILCKDGVEIALQDIGFARMFEAMMKVSAATRKLLMARLDETNELLQPLREYMHSHPDASPREAADAVFGPR